MHPRSFALAGALALATLTSLPQAGAAQSGEAIVNGIVNQVIRQAITGNSYRTVDPRYGYDRYTAPAYGYRYVEPRPVYRYDTRRYDRHHHDNRRSDRHRHHRHDRDHYAGRHDGTMIYVVPRRVDRDPGAYR